MTNESHWDKILKIKTSGRDDSKANQYYYPYEPTPYCVLERLAKSSLIKKSDVVSYLSVPQQCLNEEKEYPCIIYNRGSNCCLGHSE